MAKDRNISSYLKGRWPTLKPTNDRAPNPFTLLRSLTWKQWKFFLLGFGAWTWDAFDFHTVTLNYSALGLAFNKTDVEISFIVTLVLIFRPVGAAIFGIASDQYGREWPFIINCTLLIILELASGFCQTYEQFLAVRALFGIAMGGMYGNAAATALEDLPEEAKGLMSGIYQSGYPFGYLLATVFWKAFENTHDGWRTLFWFGACPPLLLIIGRRLLPETDAYNDQISLRTESKSVFDVLRETGLAIQRHWILLTYLILLMTGFNAMSHGTQDLYPRMLQNKYNYSPTEITITQVVANCGAVLGSWAIAYCSQIFGRRFMIIIACFLGGSLLYPYSFVSGSNALASVFFEQFFIQGAWGIIPIHLIELSPIAFRTFVVGTSYQLGNLISSASNTIETAIAKSYPLGEKNGETIYDYSGVICIFGACIFIYVIFIAILGPEKRRRGRSRDVAWEMGLRTDQTTAV